MDKINSKQSRAIANSFIDSVNDDIREDLEEGSTSAFAMDIYRACGYIAALEDFRIMSVRDIKLFRKKVQKAYDKKSIIKKFATN